MLDGYMALETEVGKSAPKHCNLYVIVFYL
jgi:hypothetical protein